MRNVYFKTKRPRERGRSSTLDILGGVSSGGRTVRNRWSEHQHLLTTLKEELTGTRSTLTESARTQLGTYSEHMADVATDSYDRDWALASLSSTQTILNEIQQALDRISNGSYGICELTGEAIEPARLKAVPWTRFSTRAQAQMEARGAAKRVQLGTLGTYTTSGEAATENAEADGEPERTEDA